MRCQECRTTRHKKLYEDPRVPSLDDGEILCLDCLRVALEDLISDVEDVAEEYRQKLASL